MQCLGKYPHLFVFCLFAATARAEDAPDYKDTLTGDWGGTRTAWAEKGVDTEASYIVDVMSTVSGGTKQGTAASEELDIKFSLDGEKLLGSKGTTALVHFLATDGGHPDAGYAHTAQFFDNIEEPRSAAKLYQAWIQQSLWGDKLSILGGLYAMDSEFNLTDTSGLFINSGYYTDIAFAFSGVNGPPILPFSALAIRVKAQPTPNFYLLAAVTDGVPGDPNNATGTQIELKGSEGALLAMEAGFLPSGKSSDGKIAIGGWRYTKKESDYVDVDGFGNPVQRYSYGGYLIGDRRIYCEEGSDTKGLAVFGRIGFADAAVNQFDYSWSTGLVYTGLIPGRDAGQLGFGVAGAHNSSKFRQASATPLDAAETGFELTYSDDVTPWLAVQPDLQYIVNPGTRPARSDAWVIGSRFTVTF